MVVVPDIQNECRFVLGHTVLRKYLENIGTVIDSTPVEIMGSFP